MPANALITVDPEILGETPVFMGTRVPVKTLFDYLEDNYSLDEFIECFPTVSREMAHQVLEQSKDALLQPAGRYCSTNASRRRCANCLPVMSVTLRKR